VADEPERDAEVGAAVSKSNRRRFRDRFAGESGTTLIETIFATSILVVGMAGLMGLTSMAVSITENQGHLGARTTEYAVDKMEQLLELTYGDAQSNTTFFPSTNSGGTGMGGNLAVGSSVGSSNPATPVVGYTDYLDSNGNVLCTASSPCAATPPPTWYYRRVWLISVPSANLKQITVTATVKTSVAGAMISRSTVSSFKTNCPSGC
jgi:hypothetical protein